MRPRWKVVRWRVRDALDARPVRLRSLRAPYLEPDPPSSADVITLGTNSVTESDLVEPESELEPEPEPELQDQNIPEVVTPESQRAREYSEPPELA